MKKAFKLIVCMTAALISFNSFATEPAHLKADPVGDLVKKTITDFMAKNKVNGVAVELYVDGVPYNYSFGYANPEKQIPVSQKTIFEIGSISKVMTGILLAQEIDYNKMALNDSVKKYVKDLPDNFKNIKLQDLATHTSGLPFNTPNNIQTKAELQKYLTTISPEYQPEQAWVYSNFGTGLLGYALEASTEKDFDKLYRRHILNPLGMVVGTRIPTTMSKFAAQGFDADGNPAQPYNAGLFPASGGVLASADDMQRFLSAAIGLPGTPTRVFYPIKLTQSSFVRLPDRNEGLGWQIHTINSDNISDLVNESDYSDNGPLDVDEVYARPTYDGNALIDKGGTTNGFRSYIAVVPNKKSGIVILANKGIPNSSIVNAGREILYKLGKLAPAEDKG